MKISSIILIILFWCIAVLAEEGYGTLFCNKLVRVYDGDTITCDINSVHPLLGKSISIRINGIDTPEMRDRRPEIKYLAEQARDIVYFKLSNAQVIELRNVSRGKYFRIVADVYADGESISAILLKANLAKPYDGGTKSGW
jgi:endonuclease YncB( thermonuclease family)